MTLAIPPINSPLLNGKTNKLDRIWNRFFVDLFRAFGGGSSSSVNTPTGVIAPYIGTNAPSGWVMFSSGTIGNTNSSASIRAHIDTGDLFGILWNGWDDSLATVSGGRGVSAISDFGNNKTITFPVVFCCAVGVSGAGTNLTDREPGDYLGDEEVTLTTNQIGNVEHDHIYPAHWHQLDSSNTYLMSSTGGYSTSPHGARIIGNEDGLLGDFSCSYQTDITYVPTLSDGVDTLSGTDPHNNIQPITFLTHIIKL
jgi:microcystin-dependent protein